MNNIYARIRKLRKERNLKQQELANYLGISQQSYSHYEQNQRELPIRHIAKIAKLYNVSTDYLLGTSTCRCGSFDLNSVFIQDIPLKNVMSALNKLNKKNRLEIVRFLSYLDESNKK